MQLSMTMLPPPKNQKAHLLLDMISGKIIAEQDYRYNRFRGSISDLINKFNAPIRHTDVPFTNSFGHKGTYRKHYIMGIDREDAISVYERINR